MLNNERLFIRRITIIVLFAALLLGVLSGCGLLKEKPNETEEPPKEYSVADLAELTGPSIAYIEATDTFFDDYFWFGSGFVVGADGLIVTNYHVLEGAKLATVEVDGVVFEEVSVLAHDENRDLALLKVEATDLKPLVLAESIESVRLGEQVIAMGNPEGLKRTVSDGIVSTLYRHLEGFDFDHIQTTAPISKGSSGGPLMTMRGEVIGVNTLTYMAGQNLNFAVPIELVHELLAGRGQPLSVAEVFGQMQYDGTASNYFEHRPGELAVVLNWEGDVDLDLEIWTADFEFMEIAAILGDSPDIIKGGQGEEWFAFTTYTYLDDETTADYSEGRYMVAVYYYGPEPADEFGEVAASLDVFYPDGTRESLLMEHLWYGHPYNQWFALLVDAGTDTVKVLDFYLDSPLVALLEWDTEADLDLAIYSDRYDQPFMPGDFWYGYDFTAGSLGLEVFRFGHFSNDDDSFDFTKGRHDIFINMPNTGVPVTTATVTLLSDDYHITRFRRTFSPDPRGDYLWWVVYGLEPERFAYFEPEIDEAVIFLDQ